MSKTCPTTYTKWSKGYYSPLAPQIQNCEKNCKAKYGPEYTADYRSTNVFVGTMNYCRCKRATCLGSASTCCTTGKSGNSKLRCDARYTDLTSACNSSMIQYCNADRYFTDKRCVEWAKKNPDAAVAQKRAICNSPDGFTKNVTECRPWCLAHPGECDVSSEAYCKNNASEPYCSCLQNETAKEVGKYYIPECNDKKCKELGYKNKNAALIVESGKCPDVVDCSAIINLSDTARENILNNVSQTINCDRKADGRAGGNDVTTADITSTKTDSNTKTAADSSTVIPASQGEPINTFASVETAIKVLVFIIVVFALVFALYMRFQSRGSSGDVEYGKKIANLQEGTYLT